MEQWLQLKLIIRSFLYLICVIISNESKICTQFGYFTHHTVMNLALIELKYSAIKWTFTKLLSLSKFWFKHILMFQGTLGCGRAALHEK